VFARSKTSTYKLRATEVRGPRSEVRDGMSNSWGAEAENSFFPGGALEKQEPEDVLAYVFMVL